MRLKLPNDQMTNLRAALKAAGSNEIGGQIFGEQLAPAEFLASELTVQRRRGSFASFFVDLVQAARDALRFFDRTNHLYERFNYVGEWHSHPSFSIQPSGTDVRTMEGLVRDPQFRGNFAVLMITRLDQDELSAGAWVFDRSGRQTAVDLELEQ